MFNLLS